MNRVQRFSVTSVAALAIAMAPLPVDTVLTHWLGNTDAYAAGNSGSHGNTGGGSSNASNGSGSSNSSNGSGVGGNSNASHGSGSSNSSNGITHSAALTDNAQIGALHASHANLQAFVHASPNSVVGKLAIYAKALAAYKTAEDAYNIALTATSAALTAFNTAYPTYANTDLTALADEYNTLSAADPTSLSTTDSAKLAALQTLFGSGSGATFLVAYDTFSQTADPTPLLANAANKTLTPTTIAYVDKQLTQNGVLAYYGYVAP